MPGDNGMGYPQFCTMSTLAATIELKPTSRTKNSAPQTLIGATVGGLLAFVLLALGVVFALAWPYL